MTKCTEIHKAELPTARQLPGGVPTTFSGTTTEAGIDLVGPGRALLVQGEDKAGAIVELHYKLSSADINVYAANGVSDGKGRFGYVLWVKQEDYEKTAQTLGV